MAGRIQAVDRALRILQVVAESATPVSLTDISARAGLHVSTTHHLLATLRDRGFIEQAAKKGLYRVGIEAFRVGDSFSATEGIRPKLHPILTDLATRSGETANLVVRRGLEAVYIDHVIGTREVKLFTTIGQVVPLHCTAVGKVFLAFAADATSGTLPAHLRLTRHTPNTIGSLRVLRRELDAVRAAGYAIDREEHERGVACIAAPVRDATGAVVAAIGISGPGGRVLAALGTLVQKVTVSAAAASRRLGCAGVRALPTVHPSSIGRLRQKDRHR